MSESSYKKVKVCMLAYNQEQFILEAINSFLSQKTEFDIELVIGEDNSTDGTRKICKELAEKWPDKINLLSPDNNLGIQDNFFRTLDACGNSDYIAFLEGDDKWVDENKLQHQVNFLENYESYIAHAHNVIKRDVLNNVDKNFGEKIDRALSKEELFIGWKFHAVSLIVRSDIIKQIPVNHLPRFISVDRFLNRWIGCHGDLYYEGNKFMSVYHSHPYGASGTSKYLELRYQEVAMLDFLKNHYSGHEFFVRERINTLRDIALFWAKRYGVKRHNYFWLISEYIKLTPYKSRKDYYYLLLALFGRPFYLLHQGINKVIKK